MNLNVQTQEFAYTSLICKQLMSSRGGGSVADMEENIRTVLSGKLTKSSFGLSCTLGVVQPLSPPLR